MAGFDWGNLGTQLSQQPPQEQSSTAPNYLGPLIAAMMQMHQEGKLFPQGQQVAGEVIPLPVKPSGPVFRKGTSGQPIPLTPENIDRAYPTGKG